MNIFISYRRADSAGFTRALHGRLVQRLGPDRVFLDADTVPAGSDFGTAMRSAIAGSDVVLVVIGPGWLHAEEAGERRLHDPADLVRQEILGALEAGARVIPVLVDGASMPGRGDLPFAIAALADRTAVEVGNTRFESDVDRLVAAVAAGSGGGPLLARAVALLAVAAGTAAYLVLTRTASAFLPGLAAIAAFGGGVMFATLRSLSRRRGRDASAFVNLAGPVAWIAAVMVLGAAVAAPAGADTFTLSVRVHGPRGTADLITAGEVMVELGNDRRRAEIGSAGQAVFPGVPVRFRTESVTVLPVVEGYEAATPGPLALPASGVIDLALVPLTYATVVRGTVIDAAGRPLAGVSLDFDSGRGLAVTDSLGAFTITLPVPPGAVLSLRAMRGGVTGYHDRITVPAQTPLDVIFAPGG